MAIIIPAYEAFWNSLDDVSHALNWTQLALVLFGTITISLTAAQYKLGLRKDTLSGSSQKRKEAVLNDRIRSAADDATTSIKQLAAAKKELAGTQEQFTQAATTARVNAEKLSAAQEVIERTQMQLASVAADANFRLREYLDSKSKLTALEERSQKLGSLQLRVDIAEILSPNQNYSITTMIGLYAALVGKTGSQAGSMIFRTNVLHGSLASDGSIHYLATFELENPLEVSGMMISELDGRPFLQTNLIGFLANEASQGRVQLDTLVHHGKRYYATPIFPRYTLTKPI